MLRFHTDDALRRNVPPIDVLPTRGSIGTTGRGEPRRPERLGRCPPTSTALTGARWRIGFVVAVAGATLWFNGQLTRAKLLMNGTACAVFLSGVSLLYRRSPSPEAARSHKRAAIG